MNSSICPLYGICGGCSDTTLSQKEDNIKALVDNNFPDAKILETVSGPDLGYRSRARFRYSKEGLSFVQESSNTNVLVKHCPVLDNHLNAFIANPPKINLWELKDAQLSCISTDKGVVYEQRMGWVTVKDRKLPVAGDVFFQSNRLLLPAMIDYVVDNVTGHDVMDLYAGVGTFSAFLEDRYRTTAVEINKRCLSLAKMHLKNTRFFTTPVEKWNSRYNVDTVIVDPPRVGLDRKVPDMIASWKPDRIIYVSCYANTMVRDCTRLSELGYHVESVKLFDFYPHTNHVETVVLLRDKKVDGHININLDVEKLAIPVHKATYDEIKAYVLDKYGFKVSSLYIAQTKEKAGIHERDNYNTGSGDGKVPICPKEKEDAIMDAFRHFRMVK